MRARDLIADDKSGDPRALKQSVNILHDVSLEGKERRTESTNGLLEPLPGEVLHQVILTAKAIGSALESVWGRYCMTDLPALLASLSVFWINPAIGSGKVFCVMLTFTYLLQRYRI